MSRAGTREDALRKWNEVNREILEIVEARDTARWYLIKDTIAADAATKSRALEISTTDDELEGEMPMGPQSHTPHRM